MNLKWLFILFFLFSCTSREGDFKSFEEADYMLSKEWIYAHALSHLKNNGSVITRPPGVDLLVLGLELPEEGGLSNKKHCVYYLVPYKKSPGQLKITEMKSVEPCPEVAAEKNWLKLDQVNDLSISVVNFKMILAFIQNQKKKQIEIPLPNLQEGVVHNKYSSIKEKRLFDGMKYLRLTEDSFDYASNRYLGKLADRFGQGSAIRCHHVNKNCETIGENRCDDCRYGWYEVVDYQCPQGGSKFCGQNHCGEKNEPACLRGTQVVDQDEQGICQNDLEPVLNADKILVCQ